MRIPFTKMHGCGNDYIYVNTMQHRIENPWRIVRLWSDRHKGIGSDGLVLIGHSPTDQADFSMRIFNADGSEAMMCGNASRCIGKYLFERGITSKTEIRLHTLSGVKKLSLALSDPSEGRVVESVTVDMGEPVLEEPDQFRPELAEKLAEALLALDEGPAQSLFVSMGNPHYVIFTRNLEKVETLGCALEHHPAFPQGCNVEFAHLLPDGTIRTRVWERGSGITMACGTGACATAVAAYLTRQTGRRSLIAMDGGTLDIEWRREDNHVYMTGPAVIVFDGEAEI